MIPIDAEYPFDAALSVEKNGDIGTKETPDMKIIFAADAAESIFVLSGQNTAHDEDAAHNEVVDHMYDEDAPAAAKSNTVTMFIAAFATIFGFILGRFFFKAK